MSDRRELVSGLLAALISIFLISGSLITSFAESDTEISLAQPFTATSTNTPTQTLPSPTPGGPTLTPSHTPAEPSPTITMISPTPSCNYPSGWMAVIIDLDDSLETLAQTYHTTTAEIFEGNCLVIETLIAGTILYVPEPVASLTPTKTPTLKPAPTQCIGHPWGWIQYIVKTGDTLYSIGRSYGTTVGQLQSGNCLGSSTNIRAGQPLYVPNVPTRTPLASATPTASSTPLPTNTSVPTSTGLPTNTKTPTGTAINNPTATPTGTATAATPTSTMPSSTATPTPLPTTLPTSTSTASPEPTPIPSETSSLDSK